MKTSRLPLSVMTAKKHLKDLIIKLREVPQLGKSYNFSQNDTALAEGLHDLLKGNPFEANFTIMPIGEAYQISGSFKATMNLTCALCAIEFPFEVYEKINEILYIDKKHHSRKEKQSRANHMSDYKEGTAFCTELDSEELDVTEFLHELIAISEPAHPLGRPDCETSCENYQKAVKKGLFKPHDQINEDTETKSPFAVLKDLKLNS